jgi:Integrase core domain
LGRSQNEELDGCGYEDGLEEHVCIRAVGTKNFTRANASCESFLNTLKREEIYANTYRDLDHLRANLAAFIEQYDNRGRLHSALGYHSPEEFEHATSSVTSGATMRFFRPRALARAASSARDQAEATEAG